MSDSWDPTSYQYEQTDKGRNNSNSNSNNTSSQSQQSAWDWQGQWQWATGSNDSALDSGQYAAQSNNSGDREPDEDIE